MLEGRCRALGAERLHRRLVGDAAERDDDAQLLHFRDGGDEKFAAGVDLRRCGLVLRRHAAHAVGDAGIDEFQTVIGPGEATVRPPTTEQLDYEVELAVVIGTQAKSVGRGGAERVLRLTLAPSETEALNRSADVLRSTIRELGPGVDSS